MWKHLEVHAGPVKSCRAVVLSLTSESLSLPAGEPRSHDGRGPESSQAGEETQNPAGRVSVQSAGAPEAAQ